MARSEADWTPPRGTSPGFDDFSDIQMSPDAFAVNAVGAPAEVIQSHSLMSAGSLNTSLSLSPEDVKNNLRKVMSGKRSQKDWTYDLSLPEATEKTKQRSTSRGGASTVSWSHVDPDPAEQSAILYGPPPGKRTKETVSARSSSDTGTRAGGRDVRKPSRPPVLHPTSRSTSSARQSSSRKNG